MPVQPDLLAPGEGVRNYFVTCARGFAVVLPPLFSCFSAVLTGREPGLGAAKSERAEDAMIRVV